MSVLVLIVALVAVALLVRRSWWAGWAAGYRSGQRDTAQLRDVLLESTRSKGGSS